MSSANIPEYSNTEEHIAELYRRIDVLHDRIEGIDLAFYPVCLALHLQSPQLFNQICQTVSEIRQKYQDEGINPNRVYALECFLETAQNVAQSAKPADAEAVFSSLNPNS